MQSLSADASIIVDRSVYDKQEKALVAQALLQAITQTDATTTFGDYSASAAQPPGTFLDLGNRFISRVVGSSFDEVCDPPRKALRKLSQSQSFADLLRKYSYPVDVQFGIDAKANLFMLYRSSRFDIEVAADVDATLAEDLAMLAEFAGKTGGYVYADDYYAIDQWLAFEGLNVPNSIAETRNLIAWLEFELPAPPALGDYHELLSAAEKSPFYLSATDRETIRQLANELTLGKSGLLQKLSYANFNLIPIADKREHADKFIESFLKKPIAKTLGETVHQRLEWSLSTQDDSVRTRQLREMVAAALIIDMIEPASSSMIAGYDLYQPASATCHPAQVRAAFEEHLVRKGLATPDHAPLAAHLLLAGTAPEFLVQDIPAGLTLDKPGWVSIAQAVALIELASPGSSRMMAFERIKAFSELAPVSSGQAELHELTAIVPVLNWAVLNDVVAYRSDKAYDKADLIKAATYFKRYMEALGQSETALSSVPPDRARIGLQALKKVMPDGPYLEQKTFELTYLSSLGERSWLEGLRAAHPTGILSEFWDILAANNDYSEYAAHDLLRLRLSILDLYLSGDLVEHGKLSAKFKSQSNFNPPADAFSRLAELESPGQLFDQAFDEYYQGVREGLSSLIKLAVCNMPEEHRRMLTRGNMTLYTVRKSVNSLNSQQETQLARNEAKGRYGIILCCENGDDVRAYELFTLRGLCRERPELAARLQDSGIINDRPTLSFTGSVHDFQPKNPTRDWPLDFAAYQAGSEPRSDVTSSVVVEKLWQLDLDATEFRPVALFFSRQVEEIAECILNNHPVAHREELYASLNTQTDLQKWRDLKETIQTVVINVVVPFKQCVEDIGSGRTDRVAEGIGGCILDGLSIIGLLVGLGASAASIIAKTGSTTLKLLKISKAVARAAVSLINPIDGLPALARKGFRLAGRGIVFLGEHGLDSIRAASTQLRKLVAGADAYNLIRFERLDDLRHASWHHADSVGQVLDIAVLERNKNWHALNLKVGGAWGPRLKILDLGNFAPIKRLFGRPKPHSYTRGYLKKAIPHAKSKLESAISALAQVDHNNDVRAVLRHVFGTDSAEAIDHLTLSFRSMRNDLDSVALSNVVFRPYERGTLAALLPMTYKRWKDGYFNGVKIDRAATRFLAIYPDNLDEFYKLSRYDDASVGDVIVHEMSHGAPDALDMYYGQTFPDLHHAEFDAVGLLEFARDAHKADPANLANPHFALAHSPGFDEFKQIKGRLPKLIQDHPALINAESFLLAVALLDQHKTRPATLDFNVKTIEKALNKATDGKFIDGPVLLSLSKATPYP
ncbi:hypothetical protein [Pseudomonas retamae]|uniref:Dermonecrotic toxin n=1 Tax=Pseudomonas retamae TaxID=702110 RepID=A0ABW7D6C7_9PSED